MFDKAKHKSVVDVISEVCKSTKLTVDKEVALFTEDAALILDPRCLS